MRLYLFDLDGTLTDSRPGLYGSFRAALAAIGCGDAADADLAPFLGMPLPMVFRTMRPDVSAAEIQTGMQAFREHFEREGIYGNILYPGVKDMLLAVRATGRKAWIVTSKPDGQAHRVVALLGIEELVDGVIGASLEETDTKTELVAHALATARVPASDALMLGDRHYDVTGARENGVLAVGALWGYGSKQELADAGCTCFVATPTAFRQTYLATPAKGLSRIAAVA